MSKTTIPTGGITADAINGTLIADDAVSEEHLDATALTGNAALAEAPSDTDEFLFSDGGTLKRIDYSYIKGGTNTPYFQASLSSGQTLTHDVTTKIAFDRADVDSASGYDTTNKRYTIPTGQGGYWHIGYHVDVYVGGDLVKSAIGYPKKNGSDWPSFNSRHQGVSYFRMDGNPMRHCAIEKSFIANISAGEYIEIFVNMGHTNGTGNTGGAHDYYSIFWGYKLAGG